MPEKKVLHTIIEDADVEKLNWLRAYLAGGGYGADKRVLQIAIRYLYKMLTTYQITIDEVYRVSNGLTVEGEKEK